MDRYFLLGPEVAGQLGEATIIDEGRGRSEIKQLEYKFDGWLGDDLLESHPCFICSEHLKLIINDADLKGCVFDNCIVSKSDLFDDLYPGKELPLFYWLKVIGDGNDDFQLSSNGSLVVSEKALEILKEANLNHCDIEEWLGS